MRSRGDWDVRSEVMGMVRVLLMMMRDIRAGPLHQRLAAIGHDVRWHRMDVSGLNGLRTAFDSLYSLRRRDYDLVHTDCRLYPFYPSLLSLKKGGTPFVLTARQKMENMVWDFFPFPMDTVMSRAYLRVSEAITNGASHLICVSKWLEEEYRRAGVPSEVLSTVHTGVSGSYCPMPEVRAQKNEDRMVITQISDMSFWEKTTGVLDLLRAYHIIKKEHDVKVWVVGDGRYKDRLVREAMNEGLLDKNVTFWGFRNDVPNILNLSDIYAHFSRLDAIPTTVMEGSACGLPVVATACQGIPEGVVDGVTGYLTQPDAEAFADGLAGLLVEREKREKFGRNGVEFVRENFSWEEHARRTAQIYGGLL